MEDEHLDTIPVTESANTIKSSVDELVPTPSESADLSDGERECDVPVNDESSLTFSTFSNPLFDSKDDFTSSDNKSFSDEDVPKENFKIYSNPLFDEEIISTKIDPHCFDYLLGVPPVKLAHTDPNHREVVVPTQNLRKNSSWLEKFSYDNHLHDRRSNVILNLQIRLSVLSPPPIPVEDSDSLMEEIDLFLASDDSMPPGIEIDDYDSKGISIS
ncbi:hypothetical protein Tco_0568996 [Tanacetum coccineum]